MLRNALVSVALWLVVGGCSVTDIIAAGLFPTTAFVTRSSWVAIGRRSIGTRPSPPRTMKLRTSFATRESLQISQFTTAGKLKSQFSFVEATDENATTTVDVTWDAPEAAEVQATGEAVTFTFVVRDDRGGTDWTTRVLCVTP